jgi:hypothetical protein
MKASQGRSKTRLVIDSMTTPAVTAIFTWRTVSKLGVPTITARLNADPASPRHVAAHPDHPRSVQAPETLLNAITGRFLNDRVFTPRRSALLAAQLPATDADAAERRDTAAAALRVQIAKLDKQQTAQITALEDIDPDSPAAPAMRARIAVAMPHPSGRPRPTLLTGECVAVLDRHALVRADAVVFGVTRRGQPSRGSP